MAGKTKQCCGGRVPEGFDEDHDGGNPEILAVEGGAEAAKEDPRRPHEGQSAESVARPLPERNTVHEAAQMILRRLRVRGSTAVRLPRRLQQHRATRRRRSRSRHSDGDIIAATGAACCCYWWYGRHYHRIVAPAAPAATRSTIDAVLASLLLPSNCCIYFYLACSTV